MTIEVVLLALASTVRPTSLAAVYALVGSEAPRRLMIAYISAGLTFTIAFGLLAIWAFNGVDINSGSDQTKGIAEIVGGVALLTFAVLLRSGMSAGRTTTTHSPPPDDGGPCSSAGSAHAPRRSPAP